MTLKQSEADDTRALAILGISPEEERAYRWLVEHSGAIATELVQALSLAPAKVHRLLNAIEAKGLITHAPERPRRYIPVSPSVALAALAARRQQELEVANGAIDELQKLADTARVQDKQDQVVEASKQPSPEGEGCLLAVLITAPKIQKVLKKYLDPARLSTFILGPSKR